MIGGKQKFFHREKARENLACKLFMGNLDSRVTEHQIVTLCQSIGKLKGIDYVWHTAGPKKGLPKGFCFVEFAERKDAEQAIEKLNGGMLLSRPLVVHWAHEKEGGSQHEKKEIRRAPIETTTTIPTTIASLSGGKRSAAEQAEIIRMKLELRECAW
eukprot:TRINITY_DN528_c1_g2_i3.p1 TRINITY_DN528_c1_g2~~TRINITY_DN528_c1_g2_i3.p1  ORF type:complete len:157 (-),score=45.23 TRINITY_DN528_c1_g2_i3:195-665(-)